MTHGSFITRNSQLRDDARPVQEATLADLDLDLVVRHVQVARERGRYEGADDPLQYLRNRLCLVEVDDHEYATLAGIICFGREPQSFFPSAVVDLGHYLGTAPVTFEVLNLQKDIGGTLFDQLSRVETYLWGNTKHGMSFSNDTRGLQRIELHEYPRIVIRELILNMLAHRDYLRPTACRVLLLRNRIEWISPGGLLPGLTLENIIHLQEARNPAIMKILYDSGYVEAFGQGLDSVIKALDQEGLAPPQFEDAGTAFIVRVLGRPAEMFQESGQGLTEREKQIVDFIVNRANGGVSMGELEAAFQDQFSRRTLQREIEQLVNKQIIDATGTGRWTRYYTRGGL